MSSLEKCLFKSFACFLIVLGFFFVFLEWSCVSIYFGDQTLVRGIIDKYDFFSCTELVILMRSYLFILSFLSLALGNILVKILLWLILEIFLPMFSSKTFVVLRLILKSLIHLEFIFVYDVSW